MPCTAALAEIATLTGLDPVAAVALPTAVTVAARKVGMTEAAFIRELRENTGLRNYIAEVCRKIDVSAVLA